MSTTALRTFDQFEQLPDLPGKRELIDGEVIEMQPPKFVHSQVARRFNELLRMAPAGQRVYSGAGYRLGAGWVQPDLV